MPVPTPAPFKSAARCIRHKRRRLLCLTDPWGQIPLATDPAERAVTSWHSSGLRAAPGPSLWGQAAPTRQRHGGATSQGGCTRPHSYRSDISGAWEKVGCLRGDEMSHVFFQAKVGCGDVICPICLFSCCRSLS